ncbi:hypothetical protein ACLOJK_004920 [Asimina triloba]
MSCSRGLCLLVERTAFADGMEMAVAVSETTAASSSKAAVGAEEAAVAAGVDGADLAGGDDSMGRRDSSAMKKTPVLDGLAGLSEHAGSDVPDGHGGFGFSPDLGKVTGEGGSFRRIHRGSKRMPDRGVRCALSTPAMGVSRRPWLRLAEEDEAHDTVLWRPGEAS